MSSYLGIRYRRRLRFSSTWVRTTYGANEADVVEDGRWIEGGRMCWMRDIIVLGAYSSRQTPLGHCLFGEMRMMVLIAD